MRILRSTEMWVALFAIAVIAGIYWHHRQRPVFPLDDKTLVGLTASWGYSADRDMFPGETRAFAGPGAFDQRESLIHSNLEEGLWKESSTNRITTWTGLKDGRYDGWTITLKEEVVAPPGRPRISKWLDVEIKRAN